PYPRDAVHWQTVAGHIAERARALEDEKTWFAEQRDAWEQAAHEQATVIGELKEMLVEPSAVEQPSGTDEFVGALVTVIVDLTDATPDVVEALGTTVDSLSRQTLASWELAL